MKAHVEILIRLDLAGDQTLHGVLRRFAQDSNWSFAQEESEKYQQNIQEQGGYLVFDGDRTHKPALVAIATARTRQPNAFHVTNIVPRDCFQLTIPEYNSIGVVFFQDFRSWLKKSSFKGSIHCTRAEKSLPEIIPGEKCRDFFERYIKSSIWGSKALPSHPSDIEKLDVFICALFRYGGAVHVDEIERYLIVDEKWAKEDAAWVRRRIETGLAVLTIDRRF